MMDEQKRKKLLRRIFNADVDVDGRAPLPFYYRAAEPLPKLFQFKGDEHVLDVATGIGIAAHAIAPYISEGKLTGIDFSEASLDRARHILRPFGNIRLQAMELNELRFEDESFDAANCSFGIFFVDDMANLLKNIAAKVKAGGRIVTCTFQNNAFLPHAELLIKRLQQYGIQPAPLNWQRIESVDQYRGLHHEAGLNSVTVHQHDISYYIKDAKEWWDIVWGAGFRGLISSLPQSKLNRFKREHLAEIESLRNGSGIPLNIEVMYAVSLKQ